MRQVGGIGRCGGLEMAADTWRVVSRRRQCALLKFTHEDNIID